MPHLTPELDRLGAVLTEAIGRRLSGGGAALPAAPEGPHGLPLGARPRRDAEPDDGADESEAEPSGQARLLPVALAVGQVARGDRREQPDIEVEQRLGADQREQGRHVPRYAFWTSGLVRSASEESDITTLPVSST